MLFFLKNKLKSFHRCNCLKLIQLLAKYQDHVEGSVDFDTFDSISKSNCIETNEILAMALIWSKCWNVFHAQLLLYPNNIRNLYSIGSSIRVEKAPPW